MATSLLVTTTLVLLLFQVASAGKDLLEECHEWAERGDCAPNGRPYFMQQNCPESCHKKTHKDPEYRQVDDDDETFHDLRAGYASGKRFEFDNLEGYVTVIVNTARVCDYTELFYGSLEHMHSVHPYALEILAFPFDHSQSDNSRCIAEIEAFEKKKLSKTHHIRIMQPTKLNGPETHPVFRYLKGLFDMGDMDENFAHYFFVNPDFTVFELHYGASYKTLKHFVDNHVRNDYDHQYDNAMGKIASNWKKT
mmetsp:Transcript_22861/g.52491  ORF Transcript_22861/g.52491 Transcript_22861/m.52491 type:complete len:251 (-) Transcript_22861:911-1663(-)